MDWKVVLDLGRGRAVKFHQVENAEFALNPGREKAVELQVVVDLDQQEGVVGLEHEQSSESEQIPEGAS